MRRTILASIGFALLISGGQPALAADPTPKDKPTPATPWTGIYLGGHAGYASGDVKWKNVALTSTLPDFAAGSDILTHDLDGFMGGGQVGFNYQWSSWVFGLETAYSGANLREESSSRLGSADDVYTTRISRLFSATARAGYAWRNWLGYIRGGYAFGNVSTKLTDTQGAFQGTGTAEENHHGFAAGGGLEYMLLPNIIVGAEYNYINLASTRHQLGGTGPGTLNGSVKNKVDPEGLHRVMARLSFLFNW